MKTKIEKNKVYCIDAIEGLKQLEDNSVDLIVTDPPYALGSTVIIRPDGKPDYSKATDFMNKWEQPDGTFWEEYFKEAYRVLKYGGRIIMFGMDRQCFVNKYYACLSGLIEQQSLYWYFISSFPKSADLSKNIMKYYGDEGEETGEIKTHAQKGVAIAEERGAIGGGAFGQSKTEAITKPTNPTAQKYAGYKYSIAPLKQTCETIMIFQKSYKTGSCLHDTIAYENGDNECLCGALNIEGNRVEFQSEADKKEATDKNQHADFGTAPITNNICYGDYSMIQPKNYQVNGRYPPQTYIDEDTANILDKQSGITKSGNGTFKANDYETKECVGNFTRGDYTGKGDIGGCSKILPKCDYDYKDFDLYIYEPKVDTSERNMCMDESENLEFDPQVPIPQRANRPFNPTKNNHPTVKPIGLMTKILKLFKTPNPQIIIDTFSGSGSTLISAKHLGIDWIGFEINPEYVKITKARMSQSTLLGEWNNE